MALAHDSSWLRNRLLEHPLYTQLDSLARVRVFMEHHVFAVWDFMSVLKALQQRLTCVDVPWVPRGTPALRQMINEIVATEESDPAADGRSHFEWYLDAMAQAGADTTAIHRFIDAVAQGVSVEDAIAVAPAPARSFVSRTMTLVKQGDAVAIATEFAVGREKLLPHLFLRIIDQLAAAHPNSLSIFRDYLRRHIEVDGDTHGHLAEALVVGCTPESWDPRVLQLTGSESLQARLQLWDGIVAAWTADACYDAPQELALPVS